MGTFLGSRVWISSAKIQGKTAGVTQNLCKKFETFIKICKRKRKKVKGKLRNFQTQSLSNYWYSVDLSFCFELYQKSYMYLKRWVRLRIYFHLVL